jgi:hypothetical protein
MTISTSARDWTFIDDMEVKTYIGDSMFGYDQIKKSVEIGKLSCPSTDLINLAVVLRIKQLNSLSERL